ncbi:MAG: hypothetical protein AB8I08_31495 [Sandaracinaceae bacterium]
MRLSRIALCVLVSLPLVACEATIPEGRFACEADADCPEGMVCRPERSRCFSTLADEDEADGGG